MAIDHTYEASPNVGDVAEDVRPALRIYGHSTLFYWWPVWTVGYVMAALSWVNGVPVQIGDVVERFHPSQSMGVIFTLIFLLVILFTNVTLRGTSSVIVLLTIALAAVTIAYFDWWDDIVRWLPNLSVHMNLGFYVFFSTVVFVIWALAFFVYDRLSYWTIRPGQITQEYVVGGAEKSYDTHGMVFEKLREDLFRHWLLGFGSGDLHITTTGARHETLIVHNVLFVDWKVAKIQKLIATRPDQFAAPVA